MRERERARDAAVWAVWLVMGQSGVRDPLGIPWLEIVVGLAMIAVPVGLLVRLVVAVIG